MEKKNGNGKHYSTLDSYRAGFLTTKGFVPELVSQGEKVVFLFEVTPALQEALDSYDEGAQVGALRFANAIKALKTQIFSLKRDNDFEYTPRHAG